MANPFLVLGGIAVGIVTAAFGVLQVPGWVESAQNASAVNDLSNASIGEGVAASRLGEYLGGSELAARADELGMSFELSGGVKVCVTVNPERTEYASVALSPSGSFFARVTGSSEAIEADSATAALDAVGGLPAGVPAPVIGTDCATPEAAIPVISNAGPGGGNPGGGNGGGGGTSPEDELPATAAPVGSVKATLGDVFATARTSYGVFVMDQNGVITRSHNQESYETNFTGPFAASVSVQAGSGLVSGNGGNLYAVGVHIDGGAVFAVYKIAPDGTSTIVTTYPTNGSAPRLASSVSGDVYAVRDGQVRKVNADNSLTAAGTYDSSHEVIWASADNNGNVYLRIHGPEHQQLYKVARGQHAIPHFVAAEMHGFIAAADGTLYGEDSWRIVRVLPDGTLDRDWMPEVVVGGQTITLPHVSGIDSRGNVYAYNDSSDGGELVFKVSQSKQTEVVAR